MAKVKVTTKQLAKAADDLHTTRQVRLKLKKQVEALEAKESELQQFLIDNLPVSEASGVAGHVARAQIERVSVPVVDDWDVFYSYLHKKKAYHLLQKRLSTKAVEELWEDGKKVDGVKSFQFKKVTLHKI